MSRLPRSARVPGPRATGSVPTTTSATAPCASPASTPISTSAPKAALPTPTPAWAGLASKAQAAALVKQRDVFERKGGLSMDDLSSGAQWDEPFGWAPTNWLAISGLDAYGFHDDAHRLARKFMGTVETGFAHDGTIREKYNML